MKLSANQAVGIFDSGIGGLTVAGAIRTLLPSEKMIYFGDLAHLPYGDKSPEAIRGYSKKIAEFLLSKGVKTIVIACNTASAAAYKSVVEYVGDRALVVDVIAPAVEYATKTRSYKTIGVIGTQGTINSGMYAQKLHEKQPNVDVVSMATPLLVPMIEEGFVFDDISNAIIREYLSKPKIKEVDALILGCTHYPVIKNQIRKFYNFGVKVIDSSEIVANKLKEILTQQNLLSTEPNPQHEFYVSDFTSMFESLSGMFFDDKIHLTKVDLWKND